MTGTNLAKESLENEKAISYYNTKFVFFNNIDSEYKKTEVIDLIEDKNDIITENTDIESLNKDNKTENIEDNKTEIIEEKI